MPAIGWGEGGNFPEKLNPGHEINEAAKVLATGPPNYNSTPNTVSDMSTSNAVKLQSNTPYTATP